VGSRFILGRVLCRLAYIAHDGRTVSLSNDEHDKLMARDPEIRREVVKWSGMGGGRGRVLLLRSPYEKS
jgi:hypothetical protein